jgi:N-glycosylase/DNA lyase
LKRVVPQIAAKEGVGRDALANYIAYRLAPQGINWWPTANKLQNTEIDPLLIARRLLREHTDFSRLSEFDRNLLEQALRDEIAMEEESHE